MGVWGATPKHSEPGALEALQYHSIPYGVLRQPHVDNAAATRLPRLAFAVTLLEFPPPHAAPNAA